MKKEIYLILAFIVAFFTQTMAETPTRILKNSPSKSRFFDDIPGTNLIGFYKLDGNADDSTLNNSGAFQGPVNLTTNRHNEAGKAITFNGTTNFISTDRSYNNPSQFTVSIWFKTNTKVGGALIGFSTQKTGNGGQRDRFIYMQGDGKLVAGVAPGSSKQFMTTPTNYNDNKWHFATMTVGPNGFYLYVDGDQTNGVTNIKSAENYTGYWRIGHDDLSTWQSQPSSFFFAGALDDALIYHRALSAEEVRDLYYPVLTSTVVNTCLGQSKGSIQAGAYEGVPTYEYSINGGSYSTTSTFTNLAAGSYAIRVRDANNRVTLETIQIGVQTISQVPEEGVIGFYKMNANANDEFGNNQGNLQGSLTQTTDRYGSASKAYSFSGSNQYISTNNQYKNPQEFTISIWFKTTTTTGGKLIGFSNAKTGNGSQYDRHIYMSNAGKLFFGIYNSKTITVNTAENYNDDEWHHALATASSAGLKLYVDGVLRGSNSSSVVPENYSGYWRIGGDNLSGWPDAPSSNYFKGTLDDALIYHRALTTEEIAITYQSADGAGNNGPVCAGSSLNLTSTSLPGATYAWASSSGFTATQQNPAFPYTNASAGLYTVTVTSTNGCVMTAQTNVTGSNNPGQWTGNINTNWNNASNWCDGLIPTSSTDVTISAGVSRMPVVNSAASVHNLTIAPGASLTTQAAGILNISGMLTNSGTMNNSGITVFNGTTQQTYSGVPAFNHITINNVQGLKLTDSVKAANVTIQSGTLFASEKDITITGNWTNNSGTSAFVPGSAIVRMIGTTPQTIGGTAQTTFSTLYASNVGSTITLAQNISIQQSLIVGGMFDLKTFTANRNTPGGTFYVNATGYLKIGETNSLPSGYTTNTFLLASIVEYNGLAQTISAQNYGTLILSSNGASVTKTVANSTQFSTQADFIMRKGSGTGVTFSNSSNLLIGKNVLIEAGATLNANTSAITVNGNWQNDGVFNGMTGKVILAGASSSVQGTGGQNFNDLMIAGTYVTFSNHSLTLSGNFETTGQGSFAQAAGGTLTMTGNDKTIKGTGISIENLTISGTGKVTVYPFMNITGNLIVSAAVNTLSTAAGSTITMSGTSKTISGNGSLSFANLNITGSVISSSAFTIGGGLNVDGTFSASAQTATFNGNTSLSGTANLFNVAITGTKLHLSSNSNLGIANALTFSGGAVLDVTTSIPNTVTYNGARNQTVINLIYHNLVFSNEYIKTAQGAITVNHNLDIQSATTFKAENYTHKIGHDWINNGIFTRDVGTIKFVGSATSHISGATDFNNLTLDQLDATSTVILLSDVKTSVLNMTKGTLETGSKKIEITSDRMGPGFIWGNIQRSHVFADGQSYAFGGPENKLSFLTSTGISSVMVTVEKGAPTDFPSHASINRWYQVSIPAGTYTSANWRMEYDDNFLNGNKEDELEMWSNRSGSWASVGANDDSDMVLNYVEKSGLTNLSRKWTLSAIVSEFAWKGSIDTDWNKPGNWQSGGVPADRIPDLYDVVKIGEVSFANQPTISTNVAIKNLVFGSFKNVTIILAPGGSLTSGDITANWSGDAIHTININAQTLNVHGNVNLGNGVTNRAIQLNIGSGTTTVSGWISLPAGAKIDFTGNGLLKIGEKIALSDGVFIPANGTVEYNGTINQEVASVNYHHLKINKTSGLAEISSLTSVNGDLSIVAGKLTSQNRLVIKGNVNIGAAATFENKNIVEIAGNWLNSGIYDATGINTIFNGTGTQTISASTFNNMEFNKPVNSLVELTGDVTVKGSLVGTSGSLNIKSFHFNRLVLGGSATMTDNATLIIGDNNAPTLFGNYYMSPGSTIIFDGIVTQVLQLPGLVYGNVIFRNSGTKQLTIPITVAGKLSIESGATLQGGSNAVTLLGDWENTGTFVPQDGTVIWKGINKKITGATIFNKVIVSGEYLVNSTTTFNGLLEVTSSGKASSIAGVNYFLNSDLTTSGNLNILGEGIFSGNVLQTMKLINATTYIRTITFNGSVSPQMISTSAPQFGILNVNNTGGVNPSVGWTVLAALNVGPGATFNAGPYTHLISGNMDNKGIITSTGNLNFQPSPVDVSLNFGTQFSSTGLVKFGGSKKITISGTPASFKNLTIENTNPTGISPSSNWTISNNFNIRSGSVMNAGSYQYFLGGDLENAGIINKQTSKFIFNGTEARQITSTSPFHNVTINKTSGTAILLTDMKIDGTLDFIKGNITTGANRVLLTNNASLINASQTTGWVNGKLNKFISAGTATKTFEIGDVQYFTPVDLDFESITTPGGLTVNTTPTEHPHISTSAINPVRSIERYFTIFTTGLAVTSYHPRFHFVSEDVDAGVNLPLLHLAAYNGSSWTNDFTSVYEGSMSVSATGLTWFGDMAIGEICNLGTTISYSKPVFCTNEGMASIIAKGTLGGVFSSEPGLSLDATSGKVDLIESTPGEYVVTYFIASTTGCREFVSRVPIAIGVEGVWAGKVSSDWSDVNNWSCSGVPTSVMNVVIPSGLVNYPLIAGTSPVNDLTIQKGASLKVTGSLQLFGAITNNGTMNLTDGLLEMNGTAAQVISGDGFVNNSVANLVIKNVSVAGVILDAPLNITDALTTTGQGFTLHTNDHLTLKSTAHQTARVGNMTGNNIIGNVTVEHYLSADKAWRLLSIPTNTTQTFKQSWQEGATSTDQNPNPGYGTQMMSNRSTWKTDGFDVFAGGGPSIKTWSNADNNWVGVSSTNNKIEFNGGYLIIIRGDRTANAFNSPVTETTLRTKGLLKMGDQPIIGLPTNGYTGIGNPYAAPVDFSRISMGGGVDKVFYAWDPYIRGNYNLGGYQTISAVNDWKPIPGGSQIYSTDVPASIIRSGQAILIHTTPVVSFLPAHKLQFTESAKEDGISISRQSGNLERGQGTKTDKQLIRVTLLALATSGHIVADGNVAAFSSSYSNLVDGNDALKLLAGGENFGLRRDEKTLAIEARSDVKSTDTLHYYMTNLAKKTYRLHFAPVNMERAGVQAYLLDNFLNTEVPVSLYDTTGIDINITSNAASAATNRFKMIFRPMAPLAVNITSVKAVFNKNDIDVSWTVGVEEGIERYEVEKSFDGDHFIKIHTTKSNNRPGSMYTSKDDNTVVGYQYYRIRIISQNGEVSYSKIVKVLVNTTASKISVFPNPVVNGKINVRFENQPEGKYNLRLFNAIGQLVINKLVDHNGNSSDAVIQLSDKHAKGIYRLEIQSPHGDVQTIQVIH